MKFKLLPTLLFYFYGYILFGQSLEIGPMFNLERTTFTIPTEGFSIILGGNGGISENTRNTGRDSNIAVGGYISYYFDGGYSDRFAVSAELFYNKTSSPEFGDNSFSTISLIPYFNISFFDDFPLFFGFGGGIAFAINTPTFEDDFTNERVKNVDIPLKLFTAYRLENIITIELGVHGSVTKIIEDIASRNSYYFGVKVPLNKLL